MKNKNGTILERLVRNICEGYREQGIATLEKVEAPTVTRGKIVIHLANPFLDFVGCMHDTGRAVFLEVKHTNEPRLSIFGKGGLTAKQCRSLEMWQQAGAIVGVLWYHHDSLRFVSYDDIETIHEHRKSVPWNMAQEIPKGQTGEIQYDFLNTAQKNN